MRGNVTDSGEEPGPGSGCPGICLSHSQLYGPEGVTATVWAYFHGRQMRLWGAGEMIDVAVL